MNVFEKHLVLLTIIKTSLIPFCFGNEPILMTDTLILTVILSVNLERIDQISTMIQISRDNFCQLEIYIQSVDINGIHLHETN